MPRFQVSIEGGDLDRANAMLNGAGVATMGAAGGRWSGDEGDRSLQKLAAVVEAETVTDAVDRVSELLPKDEGYVTEAGPAPLDE